MTTSASAAPRLAEAQRRFYALDALRGLAILGMILSGQLPFGQFALPAWMYHAQVPPPDHKWIATLPGITWVDLVFPFFIFSMGAAIPLALTRRLEARIRDWRIALFILERGLLLGFFALYVQAIRPYVLSDRPSVATWATALLGFALLFALFTRLPSAWPAVVRWATRGAGGLGAVLLLVLVRYPDGSGFSLERSDIIIVVLANLALFGSLLWWVTREKLLLRLGVLGLLVAFRLSNMPQAIPGWVSELWRWSPAPWVYKLYYLQYLFILIPGTIAGDLLLQAMRPGDATTGPPQASKPWSTSRGLAIAGVMVALVLVLVAGLKARWLVGSTLATFGLCLLGCWLLAKPGTPLEGLYHKLFQWAIYWLVLGLCFEPYEGGIKKDRATMSYYFITAGLALALLLALSIFMDLLGRRRWFQLLIDNGQNPMVAYAGINNFVLPILALTGLDAVLSRVVVSPWLGFAKGAFITLVLALSVSFCTRRKLLWRT